MSRTNTHPHESTDLVRPNTFIQRVPDIATAGSLRWQLNRSSENGLDASGAVIRKHTCSHSKRPIVFIDVPAYFRWLRGDAKAVA
jgi:hypothetical protein